MAKPKEIKRQEATWRQARAELVRLFLNDSEAELQAQRTANGGRDHEGQDAEDKIVKREAALENYRAIPWAWRETALDNYYLGADLPGRLEKAQAQERAQDLDHALAAPYTKPAAKPRF